MSTLGGITVFLRPTIDIVSLTIDLVSLTIDISSLTINMNFCSAALSDVRLTQLLVLFQSFGLPVNSVNAILQLIDQLCVSDAKVCTKLFIKSCTVIRKFGCLILVNAVSDITPGTGTDPVHRFI